MQRQQYMIAVLILITGILPLSTLASNMVTNLLALGCFSLALVGCVRAEQTVGGWSLSLPIRIHRPIAIPLVLLWILFAFATLSSPSMAALLRLPAYVLASAGAVFVLPAAVGRRRAYRTFAVGAALVTLVGLPGLILGTVSIGPITLSTISVTYPLLGLWEVHNPASVFAQPNPLALLAAVGLISAVAIVRRTRDTRDHVLFAVTGVVCAIGVLVTRSRAIWGALAAVAALYVAYRATGRSRRTIAAATALGAAGVVATILALSGVLPEPLTLNVPLSHRGAAWTSAFEAAAHRPFVGWGPGNVEAAAIRFSPTDDDLIANSYLRMFAMTGVVGGLTYLGLCAAALRAALARFRPGPFRTHDDGFVTYALIIIVLLVQIFEALTLFGFALLSILGMLFVGYAQPTGRSEHVLTFDLTTVMRMCVSLIR